MLADFSCNKPPEKYSSYKKRKYHEYCEKARKLINAVDDSSLKPVDKKNLRIKLAEILNEGLRP